MTYDAAPRRAPPDGCDELARLRGPVCDGRRLPDNLTPLPLPLPRPLPPLLAARGARAVGRFPESWRVHRVVRFELPSPHMLRRAIGVDEAHCRLEFLALVVERASTISLRSV